MQPSQGGRTGEGIQRRGLGTPRDSSFIYEATAGLTSSLAVTQAICLPAQPMEPRDEVLSEVQTARKSQGRILLSACGCPQSCLLCWGQ